MIMTVINLFFLVAYLLSAAVQYNDSDALVWIAIYLSAAIMCAAYHRRKLPRWLPLLLLGVCTAWIITLLPNIVGQVSLAEIVASISMQTKAVEEAREIGGLTLVALWAGVLALHSAR